MHASPRQVVAGVALAALVWSVAWALVPYGPDAAVPSLRHVLAAGVQYWNNGWLWEDFCISLARVGLGVLAAFVAATSITICQVLLPRLSAIAFMPLGLLRSFPPIALGPLAITWLGVGGKPAVLIVAFGAFFPIYQSLRLGVDHVEREHLELARCFGASRLVQFVHVVLPTMLAHALSGLYIGLGVGWFCVVAAEMLGAGSGLGFRLQSLSMNLATAGMWFYLLTIGLSGWLMVGLARQLAEKLSPWRASKATTS